MFIDALKWCGSEGCVTYGANLIARGTDLLDEETSLQWLSSMNMVKNPSAAMIEAMLVSTLYLDTQKKSCRNYKLKLYFCKNE